MCVIHCISKVKNTSIIKLEFMTFYFRRGKNSQKDEIPSPIWPKYVGGGASEDGATNKGVQIMKERWFQQRKNTTGIVTDDKDDERDDNIAIGDMSQRKIGTIYTWLEGVNVRNGTQQMV